jgi:hypothetical protein
MDFTLPDLQAYPGQCVDLPEGHVDVLEFQQDITFFYVVCCDQSFGLPSSILIFGFGRFNQ